MGESSAQPVTRRFIQRIQAFLTGDFTIAEGLENPPRFDEVPWIMASASDPEKAEYALAASLRGYSDADKAMQTVQAKAATLLTTVLALFAIAAAATILPAKIAQPWPAYASFMFFVVTDLLLLAAAAACFLASGPVYAGSLNVDRLAHKADPSIEDLKTHEADAWYNATMIAFMSGHRKAQDLFFARRLVVGALIAAVFGAVFLPFGRGSTAEIGEPADKEKPAVVRSEQPQSDP